MPVDKPLPTQELVYRQLVALAGVLKTKEAAAHRGNNLCFSPDNPAFRIRRREIGNGQRTAIGTKDITEAGAEHFGHSTLTHDQDHGRTLIVGA